MRTSGDFCHIACNKHGHGVVATAHAQLSDAALQGLMSFLTLLEAHLLLKL